MILKKNFFNYFPSSYSSFVNYSNTPYSAARVCRKRAMVLFDLRVEKFTDAE